MMQVAVIQQEICSIYEIVIATYNDLVHKSNIAIYKVCIIYRMGVASYVCDAMACFWHHCHSVIAARSTTFCSSVAWPLL